MKNLNREINLNKKFIIIMIFLSVLTIGLYYSYALFEISVIQNNVVVIKTASIDITTEIVDNENATFTLASGESKDITVNLTTEVEGDIGYKMYYDVTSGVSTFLVTSTENFTNDIVEGVMNTSKTITFTFENTGSEDISILLGTQGGLSAYSIPLEQGVELVLNEELGVPLKNAITTAVKNPTDTSCETYVEEDGITYISGTADCIDFNYVWYSGKLWRITAIYPDGTIKMITDNLITTINWGSNMVYEKSYIREWLNQEFLSTLYNYENVIVENVGWYSINNESISTQTQPKPVGNYSLTDSIGLLNSYEYYKSYVNTLYSKSYLNVGYSWWLISTPEVVTRYGEFYNYGSSRRGYGVRPVIYLKANIQLIEGIGTEENPYKIKGDIEDAIENTTLLNMRQSGEYVKLENDETNQIFRIVNTETRIDSENGKEELITKIILNDYVRDTYDLDSDTDVEEVLKKYFSSSSTLWTNIDKDDVTYWRGYLNNIWLKEIDNTYNENVETSNILEKGNYYLGYHNSGSYKTSICSTISSDISVNECIENGIVVSNISDDDYVGLPRVGEMFASQLEGYTYKNEFSYWMITPYSSSRVRRINFESAYSPDPDSMNDCYPSKDKRGARPTIHLKSEIVIKSGSGTKQDPFVVGLPETDTE